MRYAQIVLLMLLSSAVASRVSAQTIVIDSFTVGTTHPDDVVARMMSFDRDGDGQIAASELPERMQALIARGDTNQDGALDGTEVRTLALRPPSAATVRGFQPGMYSFGDEIGISSRSHIEGALEDLRLSSESHHQALAIVHAFMDALEADATATLIDELDGVFSPSQLADLKAAVDRPDSTQIVIVTPPRNAQPVTRFVIQVGIEQHIAQLIAQYAVELPQKRAAFAAMARFKARLRPGVAERTALLKPMMTLLTDEERDNFRAALERRPVVRNVAGFMNGGVIDLRDAPAPVAR